MQFCSRELEQVAPTNHNHSSHGPLLRGSRALLGVLAFCAFSVNGVLMSRLASGDHAHGQHIHGPLDRDKVELLQSHYVVIL